MKLYLGLIVVVILAWVTLRQWDFYNKTLIYGNYWTGAKLNELEKRIERLEGYESH